MAYGIDTVNFVVSAATANGSTFTVGYPTGRVLGEYQYAKGHVLVLGPGINSVWTHPAFTISFGASNITVTNPGATIPAGTTGRLQLVYAGSQDRQRPALTNNVGLGARVTDGNIVLVNYGAPATISTTVVLATTAVGGTTLQTLATAVTLDMPRALQIVSSNAGDTTQVITIRGTDEYSAAMSESITANGTTPVFGKKAFKTVISYQSSASMAGNLSIGNSKILGLPFFMAMAYAVAHIENGVSATAGTLVEGKLVTQTATTGDVRGTWSPNGTLDGSKTFQLLAVIPDINDRGITQYSA